MFWFDRVIDKSNLDEFRVAALSRDFCGCSSARLRLRSHLRSIARIGLSATLIHSCSHAAHLCHHPGIGSGIWRLHATSPGPPAAHHRHRAAARTSKSRARCAWRAAPPAPSAGTEDTGHSLLLASTFTPPLASACQAYLSPARDVSGRVMCFTPYVLDPTADLQFGQFHQ